MLHSLQLLFSEKDGDPVRKSFLLILVLLLAVCTFASAETEYALEACSGKIQISENDYIVLTPSNLAEHPDLLASIGKSQEELVQDWTERGVVLQAWNKRKDVCLEVSVFQDAESARYYDLEQQSRQVRNEYLKLHQKAEKNSQVGYSLFDIEWKKQKLGGNFLKYEYKHTVGDTIERGLARKTVRNGYTILLDYKVYGRRPTRSDDSYLNKIANTIEFEVRELPAAGTASSDDSAGETSSADVLPDASGLMTITTYPPKNTNTGTFTIEGTAYPESEIIFVAMRYTETATAQHYNAITNKRGQFKINVVLPETGVYHSAINMYVNNSEKPVADQILNEINYNKTVLPYTLDNPIPEQLTTDELVISGHTDKGVTIQCLVTTPNSTFDKTVRTNGTGVFKFKVPTKDEAEYDIALVFSKANLNTERVHVTATRNLSPQDVQDRAVEKALHPAYNTLVRNINSYIGETIWFDAYVLSVDQSGDEWLIKAACKKNGEKYSNFLYYSASADPNLTVGEKVRLYGICRGTYQDVSEEGAESNCPDFDFQFVR